jgi:very-short-patch-repair endonuclease
MRSEDIGYRIDAAEVDRKIAWEADGPYHRRRDRKIRDDERDRWLTENGWVVKRLSYSQLRRLKHILNQIGRMEAT